MSARVTLPKHICRRLRCAVPRHCKRHGEPPTQHPPSHAPIPNSQATTSARREAELTTELRAARDEALRWRLAASLPQSAAAANTLNGGDDAAEALRAANEHLRGRVRELTVALATAAAVGSTSHRAAAVAARATAADSRSRNSRLRGAGDGPVLPSRPTSPSWTPRAPNGTAGSVRSSSATRSVSSTQAAAPRGQGAARPRSLSAASSGAAAATVYGGGRRGTSIGPPQRVPSPAPVIRSRGRTDVRNASASGRTSAVQPRPLQHRPASESGLQARSATAASVNSTVGRNAGSATGRTTARGVSSMSSRSSWAGGSSVNSHRSDVAPAARGRGTTRQSTSATRYEPRRTTVTSSNGLSATTPRSAQPRSGAAPASVSAPLRGAVRPSSPPHPRPTSPATYTRLPGASAASLPQRPDAKAIGAWAASIIDGAIRTHRRSTDAPPLPHQRIQLIQPQPAARTAYTSTPSLRPEPLASTAAVSIPLAAARAHSAVFEVLPWSDVTAAVAAPSLRRTAPPADGNSSVNMEAEAPLTAAALRLEQRVDERTAEVSRVTTAAVTAAVAGINAPTRVQSVVDRAVIATTARSPRQLQHRDALATTLPHADVLSFLPSLDRTVQTAKHFSVQQAQQSNFRDTTVPEAAAAAVVGGGGHGGLSTVTARSADNGAVDTAKSSSSLLLPALAASSTSVGL